MKILKMLGGVLSKIQGQPMKPSHVSLVLVGQVGFISRRWFPNRVQGIVEKLPVSSIQTVLPIFMQNICKLILYICIYAYLHISKIITQTILWKSFQKLKCSLVNSVMQVFFKFNQILMNSPKCHHRNV